MTTFLTQLINRILEFFYPFFRKWMSFQVYAYLAVGAANTVLNIALFVLFYQWILSQPGVYVRGYLIASYTLALLIAFLLTVLSGFWLSKNFAFKESDTGPQASGKQLGKYFLVVAQGLGSDYLLLKALIVFTGMHPTTAKIISTVVVLTMNYLLQKYFTFRVRSVK